MKELSIEEKAKRYDETIEKLRDFYRDYDTVSCLIDVKEELANLFPELRESESEDEKIRKTLIHIVKGACDKYGIKYQGKEINEEKLIAWLEKQGESELSKDLGEYIAELSKQFPEVSFAKLSRIAVRIKNWLEKQGEKGINGNEREIPNSEQKPAEWHREDEQNLNACLGYIPDEFLRRWLTDAIHVKYDKPAECRQETKPNGGIVYEDFNEGDGSYKVNLAYMSKPQVELIEGLVDSWQNTTNNTAEWSAEDEKIYQSIMDDIVQENQLGTKQIDWIRNIKYRNFSRPQKQWKPNERQIKALKEACDEHWEHDGLDPLYTLWEQLSKLMEE